MHKTLLLNASYETMGFISLRKLIKLIMKYKVEILATWDNERLTVKMDYPAIVRMRYYIRRREVRSRFNRKGVFRRDRYQCQYCGVILAPARLTLDHVLPVSKGGKSSWENCLTSCLECNSRKGNRTPDQAKMKMLSSPAAPERTLDNEYILTNPKHPDWEMYFPMVQHVEQKNHREPCE